MPSSQCGWVLMLFFFVLKVYVCPKSKALHSTLLQLEWRTFISFASTKFSTLLCSTLQTYVPSSYRTERISFASIKFSTLLYSTLGENLENTLLLRNWNKKATRMKVLMLYFFVVKVYVCPVSSSPLHSTPAGVENFHFFCQH